MAKTRKVVITAYGDESKLAVVEADLPDPSSGEVQLTVDYSVVCGSDVAMLHGTYPFQKKPPLTPGYSVVGKIRLNGRGCTRFAIGDRVTCLTKYEGQSELINLPEKNLVAVPPSVDGKAAVALVLDWTTAYQMLHRAARVRPGQRIFVHALGGALGGALLRLAQRAGAEVYGTASPGKHEELRQLGATPFNYAGTQWIAAMQTLGGVDAVFDPLGYESFDHSYSILRRGGILIGYALNLPAWTHSPARPILPTVLKLFARNLLFWTGRRTTFFSIHSSSKHFATDLEQLLEWVRDGSLSVPIRATFTLDEIQQAHREYATRGAMGSIIIEIAR